MKNQALIISTVIGTLLSAWAGFKASLPPAPAGDVSSKASQMVSRNMTSHLMPEIVTATLPVPPVIKPEVNTSMPTVTDNHDLLSQQRALLASLAAKGDAESVCELANIISRCEELDSPDQQLLAEEAASALRSVRGEVVQPILNKLAQHPSTRVSEAAVDAAIWGSGQPSTELGNGFLQLSQNEADQRAQMALDDLTR